MDEPAPKPTPKRKRKYNAEKQARYREKKKLLTAQNTPLPIGGPLPSLCLPQEDEEEEIKIDFFPLGIYDAQKQFLDLLTNRRFVVLRAGRQYGKTNAGMAAMCRQIYHRPSPMGVGWIVSPTYPMAEQLRHKFEEKLAPLIVDKREGNTPVYYLEPPNGKSRPYRVEVKTADNPDRLRGPTLDWVWLDEGSYMDRKVWTVLTPTVAVSKGPIFITTTPAGKDWVYEYIIDPCTKGDKDCGEAHARSIDAKHFTEHDIEVMRRSMSAQMARQELEAEIISFDGVVYPQFLTDTHVVDPVTELPQGASLIGGVDFGWSDPFVHLTVMKHNGVFTVIDEYYRGGQYIEDHAKAIKGRPFYAAVHHRWADPSNPQMMAELQKRGIGSYPANNDIKLGVDSVRRLLEQRKLLVARNCRETIREFSQYHYPDNPDKNTKDLPVDAWNHAMDALRYAIYNEEDYKVELPFDVMDEKGVMKRYGPEKENPWLEVDEVGEPEGFHEEEF